MIESIYAAIGTAFGQRELPDVGTRYDDWHTVILCPVCRNKTLDNYDICTHCGWEYDGFSENHYSAANGATLAVYREEFQKAIKEIRRTENV